MKRQILIISILFFFKTTFSQDQIKLVRGKQTVTIDKNKETYLYQTIKKTNGDSVFVLYDGKFEKRNLDSIILKPIEVSQFIHFKDKRVWETHVYYHLDSISRISLHINDIDKILINRHFGNALTYTGLLAGLSAVIVAPLVSANFKQGTFDKNKYATIAGTSIAVFVPCLIIGLNISYRHYYIKGGKKNWTIVK